MEVGYQLIEVGNCVDRALTPPHVRVIIAAFQKFERAAGSGRKQLAVGIINAFPRASTHLNLLLSEGGIIGQKDDRSAAFQSADRAPTYKQIFASLSS